MQFECRMAGYSMQQENLPGEPLLASFLFDASVNLPLSHAHLLELEQFRLDALPDTTDDSSLSSVWRCSVHCQSNNINKPFINIYILEKTTITIIIIKFKSNAEHNEMNTL